MNVVPSSINVPCVTLAEVSEANLGAPFALKGVEELSAGLMMHHNSAIVTFGPIIKNKL